MLKPEKFVLTSEILSRSIVSASLGLPILFYLDPGLSQIVNSKPINFNGNLVKTIQRKGQISGQRMNIAGVKIGTRIPNVIKLLGKPTRQKIQTVSPSIERDDVGIGDDVDLFYPGLQVKAITNSSKQLSTATVYAVIVQSSRYSTGDGIRIGDSQRKVIKTYGTPEESIVESNKFISYWKKPYGTGGLSFEIKDGVVKEISLSVSII
jgi:hypothetical protein